MANNSHTEEGDTMSNREIALQLTLKLLDIEQFENSGSASNADYGRMAAELFNSILNSLCQD
jgi:hypothetical protein